MSDRPVKTSNDYSHKFNDNQFLCSMQSEKAQELVKALGKISKTPDNIREWIEKIQNSIEELGNSHDKNPKAENLLDDKHNRDVCINELKQLLEYGQNLLRRDTT